MSISIIGSGAIGLLYATYLVKGGYEVTLYTRTERQANRLNEEGILFRNEQGLSHIPIRAKQMLEETIISDPIVIVAVKQHQLHKLYPVLERNSKQKSYIFLQNGMGHLSIIEQLANCEVIVGVVEHGAMKIADNQVQHTGVGKTKFSFLKKRNDNHKLESIIHSWAQANFSIEMENDWYRMLAGKLVVNAVINPLTSIFRIKNGTLLANDYYMNLMHHLYEEAVDVLQLHNPQELWYAVLSICKQTSENESSMFRDVQAKRKTEIDAISGYIVKRAQQQQKTVPYTEFVYTSIKAIEHENGQT